jgi:hypothetical protein
MDDNDKTINALFGSMYASISNNMTKYDPFNRKGLTLAKRAELRRKRKKKK